MSYTCETFNGTISGITEILMYRMTSWLRLTKLVETLQTFILHTLKQLIHQGVYSKPHYFIPYIPAEVLMTFLPRIIEKNVS